MPTKPNQKVRLSNRVKPRAKMSKPDHQPQPSTALLKRPVPPASVEKARKMFKNFTLSKFTKAPLPQNHVGGTEEPYGSSGRPAKEHYAGNTDP